jgi:hypothetical protein
VTDDRRSIIDANLDIKYQDFLKHEIVSCSHHDDDIQIIHLVMVLIVCVASAQMAAINQANIETAVGDWISDRTTATATYEFVVSI